MPFPVNPVHRLLLEDNVSFLLLEDNTSKLILDEQIALDDPLNTASVSSTTPALDFVGEALNWSGRVQNFAGTTGGTFPSTLTTSAAPLVPTLGNTMVVALMLDGQASSQTTTMIDSAGNTYTRRGTAFLTSIGQVDVWQAPITKTVPGFTVTAGGLGSTTAAILAEEWLGNLTFDKQVSAVDGSGGTSRIINTGATATSTGSPQLVFLAGGISSTTVQPDQAPGYNLLTTQLSSPSRLATESKITTGLDTQTGIMRLSAAAQWEGVLCTFTIPQPNLTYEVEVDTVNTFDSVPPALIDSYSESNVDIYYEIAADNGTHYTRRGQSFTGNGSAIGFTKFYLKKSGNPTGSLTAKVYAHTGTFGTTGTPTGAAIATSDNFDASTLTTSAQLIIFTFSGANQITLTNGTNYVVVVDATTVGDASNFILIGVDTTSPTASGTTESQLGAGGWIAGGTIEDIAFYVYTTGSIGPLLDKTSDLATGFIDDTAGETTDPFLMLEDDTSHLLLEDNTSRLALNKAYPSADYVTYNVPAAALSNGVTYYWRVRDKIVSGSYGSWSEVRSFLVSAGTSIAITQVAANVTATGGTQTVVGMVNAAIAQLAATVTSTGGTQVVSTALNVSITQVAATVTATGGTQVFSGASAITQVAANVTSTGGTQAVATANFVAISQLAATVTATGGTQTVASVQKVAIAQLAANVTATGGSQTVASIQNVAIAQLAAVVTAGGGTQLAQTNSSNIQVAAVVTAGGGTQTVATVNIVSITQAAATVTAGGGTQAIATVNNVSIAQVAATVTATGGTPTIATVNKVALSQVAATVTAGGGTQSIGAQIDISINQVAGTVVATGGTQTVVTLQTVAITQVAANVTATGGTQVVQTNGLITQTAANVTATGGTQVIATVNNVSITQLAASVTAAGGTQTIATVNNSAITQIAGNVVATGGTQTLTAMIDAAIAQQAANVVASGGTQGVSATSGAASASITQVTASVTATGGVQIVSINTSPLPKPKSHSLIFLVDGNAAIRLADNLYMPL